MTFPDELEVDLDRIEALAVAAGMDLEDFLKAATAAHARRAEQPRAGSSLYGRIEYAGGLRRVVGQLYPRLLADPLLMRYFKHLDDRQFQWLRWHMLTLLAVVTGGPSKYRGRDLQQAHADLHITGEAFDRLLWHLEGTLEALEVQPEDQQAILEAVRVRRAEVVAFEEG